MGLFQISWKRNGGGRVVCLAPQVILSGLHSVWEGRTGSLPSAQSMRCRIYSSRLQEPQQPQGICHCSSVLKIATSVHATANKNVCATGLRALLITAECPIAPGLLFPAQCTLIQGRWTPQLIGMLLLHPKPGPIRTSHTPPSPSA